MVNLEKFQARFLDATNISMIRDYYRTSKPQMTEEEIPDLLGIIKMGLPINGLSYYVIEFTSSLFFRDLILSQRDIMGAWAVSNRVAKIGPEYTKISNEVYYFTDKSADLSKIESDLSVIYERLANGETQEYVKGDLPIMTSTKFTVGIDLRTLVNFLYTIEVHNKRYFDIIMKEFPASIQNLYKIHPKRDKFNELALRNEDKVNGKLGTFNAIYKKDISMNLLAQVVRKNIVVKSDIWNLLESDGAKLINLQTKDTVEATIYLTDENIKSLQSTRCCWFAQFDKSSNQSWDYILHDVIEKKSPSTFLSELPCHGCGDYCVIRDDMMARVDKIDSHFYPCPLLIEDSSVIDERIKSYKSDSMIMKKWKDSQDLISFNPDNELYRRYRK